MYEAKVWISGRDHSYDYTIADARTYQDALALISVHIDRMVAAGIIEDAMEITSIEIYYEGV